MLFCNGEVKPKPDSACWPTQMGKKGEAEEGKEDMNVPQDQGKLFNFLSELLLLFVFTSPALAFQQFSYPFSICTRLSKEAFRR